MRRFEVLKPACFNRFSCKGSECRYTCCYGWNITFDTSEQKAMKKKVQADSRQFLSLQSPGHSVYTMKLDENGCCPFLTEERLCSIQMEHGAEPMPAVCREFPRLYHKYLNKLEMGLSLGCERVLELLYEEKEGLQFTNRMENLPGYQRFSSNIDGKKRLAFPALTYYYDIQSLCLSLLQAQGASIEDRIILLGMALFRINAMAKNGTSSQIPGYINQFLTDSENINAAGQLGKINATSIEVLCSNITIVLHFMQNTASPDKYGQELANKIIQKLGIQTSDNTADKDAPSSNIHIQFSPEIYRNCQQNFRTFIEGKEYFLENVAVASLFHFEIPFTRPENGVWKDYTFFIWLFTMIKFTLTITLEPDSTAEEMIHNCAVLFRKLGHTAKLYEYIIDDLEKKQSNSVAHMAVFLKSC